MRWRFATNLYATVGGYSHAQLLRTAAVANDDGAQFSKKRPAATVRHAKAEIAIWPNDGNNGTFYTAGTPTSRYQDEKGEFKDGTRFGRHDPLDMAEAAREAATKIRGLSRTKA